MATGTVIPSPVFTGLDTNGDPVAGGKLHTYAAGTTTNQATYSDVNLTSANANPVVLDSAGRATLYIPAGASFKYVLKSSTDVTIWTADNINAVPTSTATLDVTVTAGEALSALEVVYISQGDGGKTAGRAYLTDADQTYSSSAAVLLGLVVSDIASGSTGSVRMGGALGGFSGLTAGSTQYVSATAGALTESAPSNLRIVGQSSNTTTVVLSPVPTIIDAANITTGTLVAARGGTGNSTYAVGDLLYADSTDPTLARLAGVAAGQVLASGGVGAAPAWSTAPAISGLTASQAVFTDGSKALTSNAITGTGNVVMSASPTLTGTAAAAAATFSGDVNCDSGTLFVDVSEDRVGVGTDAPGRVLSVAGAAPVDTPMMDIKNTTSSTNYTQGIHVLVPNAGTNHSNGFSVGTAWDSKNAGAMGFYSAGDGVDTNYLYLGGHSNDDALKVFMSGAVDVPGTFTAGVKTFRIPHPLPAMNATHLLTHASIEGPQADLIYRGSATLVDGEATVNLDTASNMTEGTWVILCRDEQCFTSNETGWSSVRGSVTGNILTIECEDATSTDTISWMVVAERHDANIEDSPITDATGHILVESEV
jgi:hypothetical protein